MSKKEKKEKKEKKKHKQEECFNEQQPNELGDINYDQKKKLKKKKLKEKIGMLFITN